MTKFAECHVKIFESLNFLYFELKNIELIGRF